MIEKLITHAWKRKAKKMQQVKGKSGATDPPHCVAIIGASYAGLTIANVLDLNSIPYVIFECKSPPFAYVTGGTGFNIPSYQSIVRILNLDVNGNNKKNTSQIDNEGMEKMTREDVISTLWERVKEHVCCGENIVRIYQRSNGEISELYLHSRSMNNMHIRKHGPYRCIIGADGVLSRCRKAALQGIYLIGDARWAHDHWYDFGLRRIEKGADLALLDGVELGQKIVMIKSQMTGGNRLHEDKFCANAIWQRAVKRRIMVFVVFCAIILQILYKSANKS